MKASILGAVTAAVWSWSSFAAAAPPAAEERTVSDGVDRPIHDYSGEGDASSMELNPALLTAAPALDLALLGYQTLSELSLIHI